MRKLWYAAATIMGASIGAGVLGIPFAFAKAGVLYGILNLAIVAALILTVNLYMGEVMLRTKGIHQLTGYAEKYLGKAGKQLMALALIFGIYGALVAYLIGIGDVLSALLGGQPFVYMAIFFVIFSALIYAGIKAVSKLEFLFSYLKIAVFFALAVSMVAFFRIGNMESVKFSLATSFIPYGIVLFSLMAFPSLPEAREIMLNEEKDLKKALAFASLTPAVVYTIFAIIFIGVLGKNVGEVAVVGLNVLGPIQFILGFVFAFLAMATAYVSLGLALHEMYEYDYKMSHNLSFFITCIVPFILIVLGVNSFVKVLSMAGAFAGGLTAILIVLMFKKAKKTGERHPEYHLRMHKIISWIIILLFAAGIIHEIISFF